VVGGLSVTVKYIFYDTLFFCIHCSSSSSSSFSHKECSPKINKAREEDTKYDSIEACDCENMKRKRCDNGLQHKNEPQKRRGSVTNGDDATKKGKR